MSKSGIINGHRIRKASKGLGDDVTLTRFVKIPLEEQERNGPPRRQWNLPNVEGSGIGQGRSLFYRHGVKPVAAFKRLLVSGHNNIKIGRDVRKGRLFRGYWIYTLSLEERATCPPSCQHWRNCYGNNMPFAKRIEHGPELEAALPPEIETLLAIRRRAGLLVRLHALGDFYSPGYVRLWGEMLQRFPRLAAFGYTARRPDDTIGAEIALLKLRFGRRFAIRWSNGGMLTDCTVSVKAADQATANSFACPEQTGATAACATCGLCWNTDRNVAFIEH